MYGVILRKCNEIRNLMSFVVRWKYSHFFKSLEICHIKKLNIVHLNKCERQQCRTKNTYVFSVKIMNERSQRELKSPSIKDKVK